MGVGTLHCFRLAYSSSGCLAICFSCDGVNIQESGYGFRDVWIACVITGFWFGSRGRALRMHFSKMTLEKMLIAESTLAFRIRTKMVSFSKMGNVVVNPESLFLEYTSAIKINRIMSFLYWFKFFSAFNYFATPISSELATSPSFSWRALFVFRL